MLNSISGSWVQQKGRNELEYSIKSVGADSNEVAHLESLLKDDWRVEDVTFAGGQLTVLVKAVRRQTLEEEAAAVAAKAAADAKAIADAGAAAAAKEAASLKAKADAEEKAKEKEIAEVVAETLKQQSTK